VLLLTLLDRQLPRGSKAWAARTGSQRIAICRPLASGTGNGCSGSITLRCWPTPPA